MSLAQRVRDFRYSKGWGPDELASRASISRTALYQIESGKTELPRAGTLRRIALALDVPMESLLGHGEPEAAVQALLQGSSARRGRRPGEWIPSEGGPLNVPAPRPSVATGPGPTVGASSDARFAVASQGVAPAVYPDATPAPAPLPREHDLARKLQELLASPLGEGVANIIEESHRMLPMIRTRTVSGS
jgi:transcriptional regulator with XRE-family HTH domain